MKDETNARDGVKCFVRAGRLGIFGVYNPNYRLPRLPPSAQFKKA
jgi:hypothetical protein